MNTDGTNNIAVIIGYKYFIFLSDRKPITAENNNVATMIRTTIPITSVGPANSGKI